MLTKNQIHVLFSLIHDAKLNINAMKHHLEEMGVNISYYGLKKAFDELLENKTLRPVTTIKDVVVPGNNRLISYVEANYIPEKLGLTRQHVIFRNIPDSKAVDFFKKACDLHPYTHYRSLLVGKGTHAYAQFDSPKEALAVMNKFYQQLNNLLGGESIEIVNHSMSTYSKLKPNLYDFESGKWNFNVFSNDLSSLSQIWENISNVKNTYLQTHIDSELNTLNDIEIQLIRELTINANVRAQDIHQYYNRDRTTISKYLNNIDHLVMGTPTLYYDRSQFDLSSPQLITGETENAIEMNKLHLTLADANFPFRSELISHGPQFILILMLPPSIAPEVGYFIWTQIKEIEVTNVSVSLDNSWRYPFYSPNYDSESGRWRVSEDYIISSVFETLQGSKH